MQECILFFDYCIHSPIVHDISLLVERVRLIAALSIILCSIVGSFEAIAQNLVNQENFTNIEVVGDDVTLVGERVRTLICCVHIMDIYQLLV